MEGQPRPPAAGGSLVLAPGRGGAERLALYAIEALPASPLASWGEDEYAWFYVLSGAWRVRRLAPDTLEPETDLRLAFPPSGLSVAPDGTQAYTFDALRDALVQIDLTTGQTGTLAQVPGHRPDGLAVTAERLYVASPPDGQVWAFDRRTGRRVLTLPVGRAPAGVSLAP